MRPRGIRLAAALVACGLAQAERVPTSGPTVTLPDFVVRDSRLLPPAEHWRYAHMPGFEVLAKGSDRTTQRLVRDLQDFSQAVGIVWPALQESSAVPAYLILCGRGGKFADFAPAQGGASTGIASLALRDREQAALVLDLEDSSLPLVTETDTVADSAGVASQEVEVDIYKELHRQYIHFLLERMAKRPPAWLEEGLAQLFTSMEYSPQRIVFGKVAETGRLSVSQSMARQLNAAAQAGGGPSAGPDLTAPADDRDFNEALAHAHLMPLAEMFAVPADSPTARNTMQSHWAKQCAAFVHLCLYGDNQRYQKAFLDWVARLDTQPPSEALFRQCFGRSMTQMLTILRGYTEFTVYRSQQFTPKAGATFPQAGPVALRDGSEGEVGRIKGDALHMAGRDEAANRWLIAAYVRGSRDPELLAALGLQEVVERKPDRARKFLEAAVAGNTQRARAWAELAALRLQAALAGHGASERPAAVLTTDEVVAVLEPLFTARRLPPPLPEVYEGIAAAWASSATPPKPANLAVVDEGVRLFPRDGELTYRDATLHVRIGDAATAASLGRLGERMAPDAAARARFAALVPAP